MDIVVSRYNEDVSWTKQLPNVRIYNKGAPLPEPFAATPLPNVGREGHTYYHHIVTHYDTLAEHTAFVQGNPFDHSPHVLANIAYFNSQLHENISLEFAYISEYLFDCNLAGCHHHPGLPMVDVYEQLFGERLYAKPFVFGGGAQFVVSRAVIYRRPQAFYQKIVDMLAYDVNPIEGFVIERFHGLVFSV